MCSDWAQSRPFLLPTETMQIIHKKNNNNESPMKVIRGEQSIAIDRNSRDYHNTLIALEWSVIS